MGLRPTGVSFGVPCVFGHLLKRIDAYILGQKVDGHLEGDFALEWEVMVASPEVLVRSEDGAMQSRDMMLAELGHHVYKMAHSYSGS